MWSFKARFCRNGDHGIAIYLNTILFHKQGLQVFGFGPERIIDLVRSGNIEEANQLLKKVCSKTWTLEVYFNYKTDPGDSSENYSLKQFRATGAGR
ncbi:hypothetical protein WICPIJ_002978 [Wickerhamomyces pijperi]|uniref:Uncharacterized protein n=1 Tax=Wickerhamomyces pijperi TaxID=599730 RepID=A0A9P8TPC2_WICPI|nr:hypothetical protein WICPIJ_002978 [Wickerhamomyces pijperi]